MVLIIIIVASIALVLLLITLQFFVNPLKISTVERLFKQGRTSQAIKILKNILIKEPKNSAAHFLMARLYLQENKQELALMEMKLVESCGITEEINELEFRRTIADLYENFEQYEEALKEYVLLLNADPNNAKYSFKCGKLFESLGRTETAIKYLTKAIELDTTNANAHFILGNIYYKTKHLQEAKNEFEKVLKYNASNYDAYYFLGKILKEGGDTRGALQAFEKAQKSPTYRLKSLIERGSIFMNDGSLDDAITELERAVRIANQPDSSDMLYARYFASLCYEKLRKIDKALENWEYIYKKRPQFLDVADKLRQYQDYSHDDLIKDFLTCSKPEFAELCQKIVLKNFNHIAQKTQEGNDSIDIIAIEAEKDKWLGTKKLPKIFRFMRIADNITEVHLRSLLDEMKNKNIIRGILICSSDITNAAWQYAENRPVELYDREKLTGILRQVNK